MGAKFLAAMAATPSLAGRQCDNLARFMHD